MEAEAGEAVSLEGDLDAFFEEHRRCVEWDNRPAEDGSRVVVTAPVAPRSIGAWTHLTKSDV